MANLQFKVIEGKRSAALSIFAHGFRSFLTTLGIIIGVATVIAVVYVVQGLAPILPSNLMVWVPMYSQ